MILVRSPGLSCAQDDWSSQAFTAPEIVRYGDQGGELMAATARATKSVLEALPLEEQVRRRAYELYIQREMNLAPN